MPRPRLSRRHAAARATAGLITVGALMLSGSAGYTVRAGDTLWTIASRLGVSVSSLASANSLGDPNLIRPGQRLTVPSGGGGAGAIAGTHTCLLYTSPSPRDRG